jgi:hypothetical protein
VQAGERHDDFGRSHLLTQLIALTFGRGINRPLIGVATVTVVEVAGAF